MKSIVHTVILYDNEEEVFEHAKDLSEQTIVKDIALVIVVNKKGKIDLEEFKKKLDQLNVENFIYNPNENLGYLNGTIYGYAQYCYETNNVPKWVTISNTDVKFTNNEFYEKFLSKRYDENVWCIGPSIYNCKNKSYDNPQYLERVKTSKINRLIRIYKNPYIANIYEQLAKIKGSTLRNKKTKSQYMYSAKGCFFILHNDMAKVLNINKYKVLMYSEESYIAEIILKHDKKSYYDSEIEIIHDESAVTSKLAFKKKAKYIEESLRVIREEFYT